MPYIYKITNMKNGKIYIGQTKTTIEKRWKDHIKDSKSNYVNRPLYDAINKYGIESFKIEQVEECSIDVLDEREKYWIELYGSFKYGYNATIGGDGKRCADYDLIYALFQQGKSVGEISKLTGYDKATVSIGLEVHDISIKERIKRGQERLYRPVARLDKITEEILEVFPSVSEAETKYHTNRHIGQVCLGKRKTAGGYKWKYI